MWDFSSWLYELELHPQAQMSEISTHSEMPTWWELNIQVNGKITWELYSKNGEPPLKVIGSLEAYQHELLLVLTVIPIIDSSIWVPEWKWYNFDVKKELSNWLLDVEWNYAWNCYNFDEKKGWRLVPHPKSLTLKKKKDF